MDFKLFTIGLAGKTAEEFFALLMDAGVKRVVDIRENRQGQLSGFAKWPDLEFFLKSIAQVACLHEPRLAPSPEIRDNYRASKNWTEYEAAFLELMRQRDMPQALGKRAFEGAVALLWSEPQPDKCHRRLVAELMAELWKLQGASVEIRHPFISPPAKPARARNRKAGK